jgi:hypothetical protein
MAEQHLLRQDQTRSVKAEQIVVAHPLLVDTILPASSDKIRHDPMRLSSTFSDKVRLDLPRLSRRFQSYEHTLFGRFESYEQTLLVNTIILPTFSDKIIQDLTGLSSSSSKVVTMQTSRHMNPTRLLRQDQARSSRQGLN